MLKKFIYLCALLALGQGSIANATYNANMAGKISAVMVYTDGDFIYLIMENQPTSHPTCNPSFFVLDASIPEARLDRLYSRALTAKSAGETVNIGFDGTTECVHGYMKVHRIG